MNDRAIPLSTADLPAEGAAALDAILDSSHPLMVEAFYVAAIPQWYNRRLLEKMRSRDDGREQGLITRLNRYSFVSALGERAADEPAYFVRAEERSILQKRWMAEDPQAYRAAHQHALDFWEANPDPDPFAQAQNHLYHRFFVDFDASVDDLIDLFRTYVNDRQLAAIERLLAAAEEARAYVTLLDGGVIVGFDDLLTYLKARLAQLRGRWADSLDLLRELGPSPDPRLSPYVARASGYALAQEGNYVAAIQRFKDALELFGQQEVTFVDPQSAQNDQAYTLIALGDAYVDLATDVRGRVGRDVAGSGLRQRLQDFFHFVASLPLVLYLSPHLGRRVWHPRFWPVLRDLDWIIARLFVTGARYYKKADRILETYGAPAEGVVADERLAFLYLTWGDAQRAEALFWRLLAEAEGPLGTYHQASVRVGLGETYNQLQRPKQAEEQLRAALPVLAMYEDRDMEARARELLAEALLATGEETEAIQSFAESCRWYEAEGRWTEATRIVERLETWVQPEHLDQTVQTQVTEVIDGLRRRQYAGSFQHPVPVRFRRLVLTLLPAVLILAQLLAIRVGTGSGLAPEIRFRPAPLLDPRQTVKTELSLGVTAARVDVLERASVLLWWAALFIVGYFVLSLVLGLAAIAFTRLRSVQARGRGATVCLSDQDITVGEGVSARALRWPDITHFIRADVRLLTRPARDSSAFGLGAPYEQLVIGGSTSRYTSLRERIGRLVPPTAQIVDLDYTVLRGRFSSGFLTCWQSPHRD
jgi:tetratricopeptide (TPR) repeat protein